MKNDFNPILLHSKLTKIKQADLARREFSNLISNLKLSPDGSEPVELPEDISKKTAENRCNWALEQINVEESKLFKAQRECSSCASLRDKLLQIRERKMFEAQSDAEARSQRRKRLFTRCIGVAVLLVGIAAGFWWYFHPPAAINKQAVEAALAHTLNYRRMSLESLEYEVTKREWSRFEIQAKLSTQVEHPLYTSPSNSEITQFWKNVGIDESIQNRIIAILTRTNSSKILKAAGYENRPVMPGPQGNPLAKLATQKGTKLQGSAMLYATKGVEGWRLELQNFDLPTTGQFELEKGGNTLDVDDPSDQIRASEIASEQPKLLAKLEQAVRSVENQAANAQASAISRLLNGTWKANDPNNDFEIKISWNELEKQFDGVLTKQGNLSKQVGFTLGEVCWRAKPTNQKNIWLVSQKLRSNAASFNWSDCRIDFGTLIGTANVRTFDSCYYIRFGKVD